MSYVVDKPARVRVPVPFLRNARGAGDVVAAVTRRMGIQGCEPCKERQARLNALLAFEAWRRGQR